MFTLVALALATLALLALAPPAHAAPCPTPALPLDDAPVSADGAAHVLTHDATVACWWIVDDQGDARVAARWDRARRDPRALAALADGRVVVLLEEPGEPPRWRIAVRAEGASETRLRVELPSPPGRVLAHPERPWVALVWPDEGPGAVQVVDVEAARIVVSAEWPTTPAWTDARR